MVFFTCNHCGDSVKKPAVEKHYNTKCRGQTVNVSCMDCQRDFHGKAHVAHTKCISEAEKYSAKGFVAKPTKNKNTLKQDNWINAVRAILENSDYKMQESTREAIKRLQNHENVPRKQAKFENFAIKCLRMPKKVVSAVWIMLEKELKKMDEARKQEEEAKKLTQSTTTETKASDGIKRTHDNETVEEPVKKKNKQKVEEELENEDTKQENGVEETVEIVEPLKKRKNKKKKELAENLIENESSVTQKTTKNKQKQENGVVETAEIVEPVKKKKKKKELTESLINNESSAKKKKTLENGNSSVKEQKNEHDETLNEDDNEFKWQAVFEKIVRKTGDSGIDLKKLENKVVKKYKLKLGLEELTDKQQKKFAKKFNKHLKKTSNVNIENNLVKIC